jgi:hypothetical protein
MFAANRGFCAPGSKGETLVSVGAQDESTPKMINEGGAKHSDGCAK